MSSSNLKYFLDSVGNNRKPGIYWVTVQWSEKAWKLDSSLYSYATISLLVFHIFTEKPKFNLYSDIQRILKVQ